jgi:hypothetical protein
LHGAAKHLQGSDMSRDDHQVGAGVELGYCIALPASFYVTPWIGVGYTWGADAVMLGGKTYELGTEVRRAGRSPEGKSAV